MEVVSEEEDMGGGRKSNAAGAGAVLTLLRGGQDDPARTRVATAHDFPRPRHPQQCTHRSRLAGSPSPGVAAEHQERHLKVMGSLSDPHLFPCSNRKATRESLP